MAQAKTKLGDLATSQPWIVVTSAFFWAWFDIATFRQTLVVPFEQSYRYLTHCFTVTMLGGTHRTDLLRKAFWPHSTTALSRSPARKAHLAA